ncbi:hypothetical protein PGT21_033066 [Puccinia graminis f. sp. tritici]|uniref:Uncharacterized protein n=1 Tax=Puccinia graminis f. sp. tritici TaxID=56615 RepID=A0A5B0S0D9_PUCGR|nr:hypothetical protein PGT21_033066 [Puccinia graminis f. sp. tritici]KAA1130234.1 hypothetical protein PGTUg99_015165 [Puccinia graminis f. sp. tritici]
MDCSLRTKLSSFLRIFILIIIQFGACYGTFKCNDHGGKHHGKYQALCMRHMRDEWPDYPDLVRSKFNGYRRAQYYMLRDGNLLALALEKDNVYTCENRSIWGHPTERRVCCKLKKPLKHLYAVTVLKEPDVELHCYPR